MRSSDLDRALYSIAIAAPLLTLAAICRLVVDVPFADDWWTLHHLFLAVDGQTTLGQFLWRQHNEHRIPVVRAIVALAYTFGHYDTRALVALGFAFRLLTGILIWDLLRATLARAPRAIALVTAMSSLLLFSPAQYFNWLWSFTAIVWNLAALAMVTLVWALGRGPATRRGFLAAIGAACLGSLTLAGGVCLWGLGFLGLSRRRILWSLAGGLFLAAYFYGYGRPPQHPDPRLVLSRPKDAAIFALTLLGSGLSGFADDGAGTAIIGGAGVLVLAAGTIVARRNASTRATLRPWLLLALGTITIAGLTTIGRLGLGLPMARESHYVGMLILFWVAVAAIGAMAVSATDAVAARVFAMTLAVALVVGYTAGAVRGGHLMLQMSRRLEIGRQALVSYRTASDAELEILGLAGAYENARAVAARLEREGRGTFRASPAAPARIAAGAAEPAPVRDGDSWLVSAPKPSRASWVLLTIGDRPEGALDAEVRSDIAWSLALPRDRTIKLRTRAGINPGAWHDGDGVSFHIAVARSPTLAEPLWSHHVNPRDTAADRCWLPVEVNLTPYAGETVVLHLRTGPGPSGDWHYDWSAWAQPILSVTTK